ncbi:MAG: hypothetical protein PVI21_05495 [Candidatus Woesebacteria bacterium]|jgi:hypothetical protein
MQDNTWLCYVEPNARLIILGEHYEVLARLDFTPADPQISLSHLYIVSDKDDLVFGLLVDEYECPSSARATFLRQVTCEAKLPRFGSAMPDSIVHNGQRYYGPAQYASVTYQIDGSINNAGCVKLICIARYYNTITAFSFDQGVNWLTMRAEKIPTTRVRRA